MKEQVASFHSPLVQVMPRGPWVWPPSQPACTRVQAMHSSVSQGLTSAGPVEVVMTPSPLPSLQSSLLAAKAVERPEPRPLTTVKRPSPETAVRETLSPPPLGPVR